MNITFSPEYPRPSLVRTSYLNLNGRWECAFSKQLEILLSFDLSILVPFSPECQLSGFQTAKARRRPGTAAPSPSQSHSRISASLLHFGAADQTAEVFVNRISAVRHRGGYRLFCRSHGLSPRGRQRTDRPDQDESNRRPGMRAASSP